MKVPAWYWNIPRQERPRFASLSKYTKPGPDRETIWYLSIWGEIEGEVIDNWETLKRLRKNHID
jgi:hypothetical protein